MQFLFEYLSNRSQRWGGGMAVAAAAALFLCLSWGGTAAHAAPAPGGTVIRNVATATYVPAGLLQTETSNSNGVSVNVLEVEALLLTQDQTVSRPPGTGATLSHLIANTGNVPSAYRFSLANNGAGCPADDTSTWPAAAAGARQQQQRRGRRGRPRAGAGQQRRAHAAAGPDRRAAGAGHGARHRDGQRLRHARASSPRCRT